jgi:mannose-6-phosphate isomerase-like protein (cupin superfamily)
MKNIALKALLVGSVLIPVTAFAADVPKTTLPSVYISKEDIAKISASEQDKQTLDQNATVVDLGPMNFELGIVHRKSTHNPPEARPAGAGAAAAAQRETCGEQVANVPADAQKGALTHDYQSEGYLITSGGGTMFLDGHIINGRHSTTETPGGPNGPTCGGIAVGSHTVVVKAGDVIIVPVAAVHGWADIPDHVDYMTFRASTKETMKPGWVNPIIAAK